MLQLQPSEQLLEHGAHRPAEPRHRQLTQKVSFTAAYELWLDSWDSALAALATADQRWTLSREEAAAHKALIATERELVTNEFALLLGSDLLENW